MNASRRWAFDHPLNFAVLRLANDILEQIATQLRPVKNNMPYFLNSR
jgi:hypothetical protein